MPRYDDDGSMAMARAEARAEARAAREEGRAEARAEAQAARADARAERYSLRDLDPAPRDDLLGLRLTGETPTLAEQYGISLMDPAMKAEVDSWSNPKEDYFHGRYERDFDHAPSPPREPAGVEQKAVIGSALGGPSVTLPGKKGEAPEYGVAIPLGAGSLELGMKDGYRSYGFTIGPSFGPKIKGDTPFALAELSLGMSTSFAPDGKTELSAQARLLGYGGKLSVDTDTIARKLDEINREAARHMAPYAEQIYRGLGLPSLP